LIFRWQRKVPQINRLWFSFLACIAALDRGA
jgi:hypothetical protein